MPTFNRAFLLDAAERIGSSFLEAVVALVIAGGVSTLNASTVHVLLAAGLTAALATAKTLLAASKTGTVSPASLLPNPKKEYRVKRDTGGALMVVLVIIAVLFVAGLFASRF